MITVDQAIRSSFIKKENNIFSFFIDKNFPAFEGHFPGAPLLPGIAQIEIALFCISRILGKNVCIAEIKKAKFANPVLPAAEIFVSVTENTPYYGILIKDEKKTYAQISMSVDNSAE
ncbi:MAG: hypothetical protein FWH43_01990 [Endomicrobia bacterium]|nr:hypothetical protein [Endomicrobiia bacterium]